MSSSGILKALAMAMRTEEYTVAGLLCALTPLPPRRRRQAAALVALLRCAERGTRATKDALKVLFPVTLYALNRAALVELSLVPRRVRALLAFVMPDVQTGIVEDAGAGGHVHPRRAPGTEIVCKH